MATCNTWEDRELHAKIPPQETNMKDSRQLEPKSDWHDSKRRMN